jgi:pantetheine-phosphate adenylyltransferase
MKVCIGGTFNILHKGHKHLIKIAIKNTGKKGSLLIGLTSMDFAENKKNLKSFEERKKNLENFLIEQGFLEYTTILTISDKYGPTIDEDFDAIVVSPETVKTAVKINFIRKEKGKKPLKIVKIPYVLAKDGLPISSSRIISKEIDKNGNILNKD